MAKPAPGDTARPMAAAPLHTIADQLAAVEPTVRAAQLASNRRAVVNPILAAYGKAPVWQMGARKRYQQKDRSTKKAIPGRFNSTLAIATIPLCDGVDQTIATIYLDEALMATASGRKWKRTTRASMPKNMIIDRKNPAATLVVNSLCGELLMSYREWIKTLETNPDVVHAGNARPDEYSEVVDATADDADLDVAE